MMKCCTAFCVFVRFVIQSSQVPPVLRRRRPHCDQLFVEAYSSLNLIGFPSSLSLLCKSCVGGFIPGLGLDGAGPRLRPARNREGAQNSQAADDGAAHFCTFWVSAFW